MAVVQWTILSVQRLDVLLARMGVPLSQAKENWNCMDNTIREQFQNNVQQAALQFGLTETCYPSFVLVRACQFPLALTSPGPLLTHTTTTAVAWLASTAKRLQVEDICSGPCIHRFKVRTHLWLIFKSKKSSVR
jgi:hypothetical protein